MSLTERRVRLCHRDELRGGLQRFDLDGHEIVLITLGDALIALDDTCTHEDASLAEEGEIDVDAREVECCRHGARFSLDDGSATSLPATAGLRRYPVSVEGEDVIIEVSS
jgi:nitrite reductase/ring-hydroxylating ferredoxin subunit